MSGIFDNIETSRYKAAVELGVPSRLIIEVDVEPEDGSVDQPLTTLDSVVPYIEQSMDDFQTYQEILDAYDMIEPSDVRIIYINKAIADINNQVEDLPDERSDISSLAETVGYDQNIDKFIRDNAIVYRTWLQANLEELQRETNIVGEIIRYQEFLLRLDPLARTDFDETGIELEALVTLTVPETGKGKTEEDQGDFVTKSDGLYIFDQSLPNDSIPYIRYVDGDMRKYTKIFKGVRSDEQPNYQAIIPDIDQVKRIKPDYLYMSLWTGDTNLHQAVRAGVKSTKLDLDNGILNLKIPVSEEKDEQYYFDKITNTIPVKIDRYEPVSISGEVNIYNVDMIDYVLADMIMNNLAFNRFLFINEKSSTLAVKKFMTVHYRPIIESLLNADEMTTAKYIRTPSSAQATISQMYVEPGTTIEAYNPRTDSIDSFKADTRYPYIKIKISRGENLATVEHFIDIFARLLTYYNAYKDTVVEEYKQYIDEVGQGQGQGQGQGPGPTAAGLTKRTTTKGKGKGKGKSTDGSIVMSDLKTLKATMPLLFDVKGMSRSGCQSAFRPGIIPEDRVEEWQQQRFTFLDETYNRQAMPFEYEGQTYYFGCDKEQHPFPGIKINKLSNKDMFPVIPCCFKRDQLTGGKSSKYSERVKPKASASKPKTGYSKKNVKAADENRVATVAPELLTLVQSFSPSTTSINRMGVPNSPNSLIHSIAMAVADRNYIDADDKEVYVKEVRATILEQVNVNVVRQEMYDYTESEIVANVTNTDVYFDPDLYYRLLEERYNINIYVFNPPESINDRTTLSLPRHKLYHSRLVRKDRQVALLIKSPNPNIGQYPQCELIIDNDEQGLFDGSTVMHNAVLNVNTVYTWTVQSEGDDDYIDPAVNVNSRINYLELLDKYQVRYQYIDSYGKLRALQFVVPAGTNKGKGSRGTKGTKGTEGSKGGEDTLVTVMTIPTQPLNLPIFTNSTDIDINLALRLFGQPVNIDSDVDKDVVNGLWYNIADVLHGLYVSVTPTRIADVKSKGGAKGKGGDLSDIPVGPINPVFTTENNEVDRYNSLKETVNVITQLAIWIFTFTDPNLSIDERVEQYDEYVVVGQGSQVDDSLAVYDLTNISYRLIRTDDVNTAIKYIADMIPGLVVDGQLYMYSDQFAKGIRYQVHMYAKNNDGLPVDRPTVLSSDQPRLKIQNNVALFYTLEEFVMWYNTMTQSTGDKYDIREKITPSHRTLTDPYLYRNSDNLIYYIQNIKDRDIRAALMAAAYWNTYRINLGYESPQSSEELPYILYNVSSQGNLVAVEDNTDGATDTDDIYFEIVKYEDNSYAAMLVVMSLE